MNICELQHKYPLQNLINQTRIKSVVGNDLAYIHYEFGTLLGREILGAQPKVYKEQQLTQGKNENLAYYDDSNFTIVGIMRAGLYVAEGLRVVFPKAAFYLTKEPKELKLESACLNKVIIADSVINTGETMLAFLESMCAKECYIAANVIYEQSTDKILKYYPNVHIFAIRVSKNSYVGQGGSDTGNRLFCTM
ncbi:hypothetical protein LS73_008755 [Helicobacter muridarum]|uniref:Uracil phosphoribosyltransferase n=1 Tax=Helicobacter muridarum TaxID=216 RepID=A0A099TXW6_9HELI|nr:uracil phosphoribosyltransferase [Helicobacter muridarum]TLD98506.1 hypothetical protein LS73_008755 [Helicobacter muridarum]STQ86805.1 Uracil phosphoribosyltransferase [Helicobacter muridarum]